MPPPPQPVPTSAVVPFDAGTDIVPAQPGPSEQRPPQTFPVQQAQLGRPALPAPPPREELTAETGALVPIPLAQPRQSVIVQQPEPEAVPLAPQVSAIKPPQPFEPVIQSGSVSSFHTGDYEESLHGSQQPAVFSARPVAEFSPHEADIFSPPESHVSAALQPSANELENFLQEPSDMFARLPLEGFVQEKRREGVSDDQIVQQLAAVKPEFTDEVFQEHFPRVQAVAAPLLYLEAPVSQYKALPDVDAQKGRYDVLTTRLESLNTSNARYPGDENTRQEIREVRQEMKDLSNTYDFDPPLTVVSTEEDIPQRRADVRALQEKLISQTATVDQHIARNSAAIDTKEEELKLTDAQYKKMYTAWKKLKSELQAKTDRYRQKETLFLAQGGDSLRKDLAVLADQKSALAGKQRNAFAELEENRRAGIALRHRLAARKSKEVEYNYKRRQLLDRSASAEHDIKVLGGKRRRDPVGTDEADKDRGKRRNIKLHEERRVALLDDGTQSSMREKKKRRPAVKQSIRDSADEKYNAPGDVAEEKTVALLPRREREYRGYTPVTDLPAVKLDDIHLTQLQIDAAKKQSREHFQDEIREAKRDLKRTSAKYTKDVANMESLTNKKLGRFTRGEAETLIIMRDRVIQDKALSKEDGDALIKVAKRFMKKAGMNVIHMPSTTRKLRPEQIGIFRKIVMKAHDGQFSVTPQFANGILQVLGGRSTTYKAKFERLSASIEKNKTSVQKEKEKIAFSQKILGEWNLWQPIKQKRQRKTKGVKEGKRLLLLKQRKDASPEPPAVPEAAPEERPRRRRRLKSPDPVPDFSDSHPGLRDG